jgi:hypothetical protein
VDACFPAHSLPDEYSKFVQINADYYAAKS